MERPELDVAQVCERITLSIPARRLLRRLRSQAAEPSTLSFLEALLDAELDSDILQYVSYLMTKRAAVWWGCLCLALVWHRQLTEPVEQALLAALCWVRDQDEPARQEAGRLGVATGWECAAGALAMAAHWSGGSLAPGDQPNQPPAWDMTARAVSGAVCLAGAEGPARYLIDNYHQFAQLGYKVLHQVIPIRAEPLSVAELAALARSFLPSEEQG
ncbi:MAG: hypothetical protein AB7K24_12885 [Gemmataceae bacterium]